MKFTCLSQIRLIIVDEEKYQKLYQLNSDLVVASVVTSWLNKESINRHARYAQRHSNAYRNTGNKQQPWSIAREITGTEPVTAGIILRAGQ